MKCSMKSMVTPLGSLNELFKAAELDFEINAPYEWDERPYEPILIDTKRYAGGKV